MKWKDVVELGLELPEVSEGFWFNTPCLKVSGKSFVRLKEDRRSMVFLLESVELQRTLIRTKPAIYFITDHYRGWPAVLARLSALRKRECRLRLERAWRVKAPKKLLRARDAQEI
jgi:hypothetical protein